MQTEGYIRTNRILSALPDNVVDYNKVKRYAKVMRNNDTLTGHCGFPPIWGYPDTVNRDDIGKYFNFGSEYHELQVTHADIGTPIFRVTDGHHRTIAAVEVGIYGLEWELDRSGHVHIS